MAKTNHELDATSDLIASADAEKAFLLENALDAVVGIDERNIVNFWNKNAEIIFGWTKAEILGQDLTEMMIPAHLRQRHRMGMQRFLATGVPKIQNQRLEIEGLRKNGEPLDMELTVSSLKTEGGYRFYSFIRDVTEQKRTLDQVRQSEEELRTLANSIPQLAWMAAPTGEIFWYNDRWYEYTGTTLEEMQGWGWQAVHDPEVLPKAVDLWKESLQTGKNFEMTFPLRSRSGEFRSFLTRVLPIRDKSGQIIRWFGTNTDIEERVQVARVTKENEERLKFALACANMGSWSLDLKTNNLTLSEEFSEILGVGSGDWTAEKIIDQVIHPDDRFGARQELSEAIELNKPYRSEYRIVRPLGEVRWILALGQAQYADDGRPRVFSGVVMDITEKKTQEDNLRESATNLRAAIDSSAGGFYGVNREGITTICNSGFLTMLGFKDLSEVIGKKLHDVIHHTRPNGDLYPKEACPIYLAASTGQPGHVEDELFFRIDGSSFPVEYWVLPLVHDGQARGAVTTFIDISERKSVEAALRSAKEEAEKANELKSAFLANMSHEIRTPLGAMLGFADLLGEPGLPPADRANYIDILNRNGAQLSRVIDDILDLSKVETGHVSFEYLKIDPLEIAYEVVSLMSVLAKEKGIALSFMDDGTMPPTVVTDPTRAKQVLMNLVSNSLKFTKVGSVRITLSGFEGKNGAKCCAFEVIDTGIGIPEHSVGKLFNPFTQSDNSMTRRYGGTGLGLALSRSLARAMGGNVRLVKTELNKGSTFHFSIESREDLLPSIQDDFSKKAIQAEEPLPHGVLENVHILLVEDSADNQQLIWRYLSKFGASVDIADNGLEGVSKALNGDHDIVLMDLQMPIMDGYTAVGKLRSKNYQKPIIALTAHAMSDVGKKCRDVGCTDHLPKPINPRQLVEAIVRYAGK